MIAVAHIINDLGVGGAQRIVADIVTNIDNAKFAPIVVNLNFKKDKTIENEILANGIKVINFNAKFKGDFRCVIFLFRLIKKSNIQIVHSHLMLASFFTALATQILKFPIFVSTEHNTSTLDTKPFLYKKAALYYLKRNARIFAISNAIKNGMISNNSNLASKIRVVYNGINLKIFKSKEKRAGLAPVFTVGTLFRNDPRKGFKVFQQVASLAYQKKLPMRFVAVINGKVPAKTSCIELIKLSPGQQGVKEFLESCNAFVLPSMEEGLGLAAIEAMAVGIPVVVSDAGGLPEVVEHNKTGLVVKAGDAAVLLEAIEMIKDNKDLANTFVDAGINKVKELFSAEKMTRELESNYLELVGRE